MNILKYKYKAHKLVNTLFYVAVFGIGFILGFGTNKIDFNKLVSQVLMIDNVSALEIITIGDYNITDEFIYNTFNDYEDGFLEEYPYVFCTKSQDSYGRKSFECFAFSEEYFNTLYLKSSNSNYYGIGSTGGDNYKLYFKISLNINNNTTTFTGLSKHVNEGPGNSSYMHTSFYFNSSTYTHYSNFDPKIITGSSSTYKKPFINLDFAGSNLEFNENLFKDNPDFKEVCVPNNKKFGIISKEYNVDENITDETLNNRYYIDRDYIWFPNGVKGLSTFFYHNKSENNVKVIDKDDASYSMYGYWYWLNSKEEIDKYFGELPTSAMLSESGYTDKYKYYNYTMHPFLIRYIGYEDDYMFNVFWFKELGVNYIDSDIVDYPEDYCFYIKNKYDVVLLNTNEWGDLYTDITILGDKDITISTSQNESDVNNVGIFSVVNNFIYQIKGTIIFINTNIHNLFLAMPLIVRMFILSVLTVFIIKFIIDMIVR